MAWVPEDLDNYDLQLLDGAYSMLRPEEHTAMVPNEERERLENLFKGTSDAVNCLVCTPTLELGIDIGQLDSVLMRNDLMVAKHVHATVIAGLHLYCREAG